MCGDWRRGVQVDVWGLTSRAIVGAREAFIWTAAHIVSWLALSPSPAAFRKAQAIGVVERWARAGVRVCVYVCVFVCVCVWVWVCEDTCVCLCG
jgi:hypothetical protein